MNTRRIGATPKEAFWSGLKGGIFEKKHSEAMGSAIWLFGYLVMRQTQLNEQGEGLPRYGNPTTRKDIAEDTGWSVNQIKHWMNTLVRTRYIRVKRKGNDGLIIFIQKAKKKQKVRAAGRAESALLKDQVGRNRPEIGFRSGGIDPTEAPSTYLNQSDSGAATKGLSYSYTSSLGQHTLAAKIAASVSPLSIEPESQKQTKPNPSFRELQRQRQMPRPMTEGELDQRRRFLLRQAEELQRKYPVMERTEP